MFGVLVVNARTGTVSPAALVVVPSDLCVTCMVRVGRPRATVLHTVVCGPCWAAHGGSPDASEIGPAPAETVPSCDPCDQRHWLRALRRQAWVQTVRVHGRRNLLRVAGLVALYASWETLESRPTWAKLVERSRLHERTVARWLQELRVHGWLAHIERGSTPETRPMALVGLVEGNRAAVYGLRIPLTPEEALHRAGEQLVARLAEHLDDQPRAVQASPEPAPEPTPADPIAGASPVATETAADQAGRVAPGDKTVSPPWSCTDLQEGYVGGFSRASRVVDHSRDSAADLLGEKGKRSALRAGGLDEENSPDWAVTVPTSRFEMLVAAGWLRREHPIFARLSRFAVRAVCRPYWRAGWVNRDVLWALDHRPSVFDQPTGVPVLVCPGRIVSPTLFLRSRLRAWRRDGVADGAILPGHWTSRANDVAAVRAARRQVAARHGRAGARLLRAGEAALSAQRIAEHGRASRPPVSPLTRAAALDTADHAAAAAARRRELAAQDRAQREQELATRAALLAQARAYLAAHPAVAADPAEVVLAPAVDQDSAAAQQAHLVARAEADRAARARAGDTHARALARARAERARQTPWLR